MNHFPKATVLVTGGGGFIGSHAAIAFLESGHPVVVLDNLSTGFRSAVPQEALLYVGDIADQKLVDTLILEHNIGAIIHFAGSVVVPESVRDPLKYYDNNTSKSRSLINSAVRAGVPHFLFSSTAAVYGIPDKMPASELSPTEPINPYGWSKLMTERMLADASAAYPINFCALRYFNVAGADPKGRSGQSTAGATHLIKVATEAAVGKRSFIPIYGTDYDTADGTAVRDYIHVSDLAAAHVHALNKLVTMPEQSLVLNCGYGHGYSVLDVLEAVERVSNVKIERRVESRRAGDPASLISDNSKILATLPWRPILDDLDTIIADALAWERKLANHGSPKGDNP